MRIANLKLDGSAGPLDDLHHAMRRSVEHYFAATEQGDGHPFLTHRPRAVEIAAWAAVLEGEGNQQPHVHIDGDLSGCYDVTIPAEIAPTTMVATVSWPVASRLGGRRRSWD